MSEQLEASLRPRVCPLCGHSSHPAESSRHNCVSVLRGHLHSQRSQILELRSMLAVRQIELDGLRDMVGTRELRIGLQALLLERDALREQVPQAYGRGVRFGQGLARVALRRLVGWPLRRRERLRQAQALIELAEDRKV